MNIEDVMLRLKELHKEFGELIDDLERIDVGNNIEYYDDILIDYYWNNVMLKNRFNKIMIDIGEYEWIKK